MELGQFSLKEFISHTSADSHRATSAKPRSMLAGLKSQKFPERWGSFQLAVDGIKTQSLRRVSVALLPFSALAVYRKFLWDLLSYKMEIPPSQVGVMEAAAWAEGKTKLFTSALLHQWAFFKPSVKHPPTAPPQSVISNIFSDVTLGLSFILWIFGCSELVTEGIELNDLTWSQTVTVGCLKRTQTRFLSQKISSPVLSYELWGVRKAGRKSLKFGITK